MNGSNAVVMEMAVVGAGAGSHAKKRGYQRQAQQGD
jgi:hypothetical protein